MEGVDQTATLQSKITETALEKAVEQIESECNHSSDKMPFNFGSQEGRKITVKVTAEASNWAN